MFRVYFFLLVVLVPAAEIGILLWSGKTLGLFPTLSLIILTGVLGTFLARTQGLRVLNQARQQINRGQMPGDAVLDGICVLIGGALLLAPGFVTDIMGTLLLIPPTRKVFKHWLGLYFRRWINKGNIRIIR
ncbi:membrane protein FxsA [Neobacillus notoginsengisoli]|uniref:Membrane protein FxsA n=1 Tax=Neobacillus notoginsengisoli TaxID=1578198 RepID=A0A417YU62_9BACI|nr:FxsA family protein [Neobacillus notoginsengisoli]RHW40726.1 membrane protein FxsA [Neobacillus notoginsengisoli]